MKKKHHHQYLRNGRHRQQTMNGYETKLTSSCFQMTDKKGDSILCDL